MNYIESVFKIFISNFLNYLSEIAIDVLTTPLPLPAFSDQTTEENLAAEEKKDRTTPSPFRALSDMMTTTETVTAEEVIDNNSLNKPSKPTSDQTSTAVNDIRNMQKQGNKIYFV